MTPEHREVPSFWRSPSGWTLLVALAVGGFYLVTEHTAHLLGAAPYLILLACPLMHVFMHRGHGDHRGHGHQGPGPQDHRSIGNERPGE